MPASDYRRFATTGIGTSYNGLMAAGIVVWFTPSLQRFLDMASGNVSASYDIASDIASSS
jgi:hypothetical protein